MQNMELAKYNMVTDSKYLLHRSKIKQFMHLLNKEKQIYLQISSEEDMLVDLISTFVIHEIENSPALTNS